MRIQERNVRTFWYALYEGYEMQVDEYGNETGENTPVYSEPIETKANISYATGRTYTEQFGQSLDYDKVIVTGNMTIPITETSVLWVDTPPEYTNGELTNSYDYIVKRVSKSLNVVSIAIKKVNVT